MPFTKASLMSLKRQHEFLLANVARAVQDSLEFGGRHAVQHVNLYPQFKPQTGKLQKATKVRVIRTRGGKLLKITNRKPYASAIDKGANPHTITAKGGGMLRFKGKNGNWVQKRSVQHPGNKPYKFMYRAHRSAGRVLLRKLKTRLVDAGRRF
jgi:hypothetical protein